MESATSYQNVGGQKTTQITLEFSEKKATHATNFKGVFDSGTQHDNDKQNDSENERVYHKKSF